MAQKFPVAEAGPWDREAVARCQVWLRGGRRRPGVSEWSRVATGFNLAATTEAAVRGHLGQRSLQPRALVRALGPKYDAGCSGDIAEMAKDTCADLELTDLRAVAVYLGVDGIDAQPPLLRGRLQRLVDKKLDAMVVLAASNRRSQNAGSAGRGAGDAVVSSAGGSRASFTVRLDDSTRDDVADDKARADVEKVGFDPALLEAYTGKSELELQAVLVELQQRHAQNLQPHTLAMQQLSGTMGASALKRKSAELKEGLGRKLADGRIRVGLATAAAVSVFAEKHAAALDRAVAAATAAAKRAETATQQADEAQAFADLATAHNNLGESAGKTLALAAFAAKSAAWLRSELAYVHLYHSVGRDAMDAKALAIHQLMAVTPVKDATLTKTKRAIQAQLDAAKLKRLTQQLKAKGAAKSAGAAAGSAGAGSAASAGDKRKAPKQPGAPRAPGGRRDNGGFHHHHHHHRRGGGRFGNRQWHRGNPPQGPWSPSPAQQYGFQVGALCDALPPIFCPASSPWRRTGWRRALVNFYPLPGRIPGEGGCCAANTAHQSV